LRATSGADGDRVKALRWHGAGDLRLEEVDLPAAPPGTSLVEVSLCGICGTDVHEFKEGPHLISSRPHPLSGQAAPVTLGHEFAGRVVAVGEGSSESRIGARVTADACWRCGACDACVAGSYHLCRFGGSIGLHSDGAFASHVVVPDYCLVELPDEVSDQAGAVVEPLAVALHALDRGGLGPGDEVVVLGFGPIGASAALMGRALGAHVSVIEKNEDRVRRAAGLGFDLIEAGGDLAKRVRAAVGGGGAALVMETTGVAALIPEAVECTRRGGRIVVVGLDASAATVSADRLVLFERSVVGSLGYCNDLPKVVRMIAHGLVDPTALVSEVVPLAGATEMITQLASNPEGRIKVLVDPRVGVCGGGVDG
jgi:(R,R)-butanediol dehydrogenase/meso-butanediol dehydrogenase/diacetyl reductase